MNFDAAMRSCGALDMEAPAAQGPVDMNCREQMPSRGREWGSSIDESELPEAMSPKLSCVMPDVSADEDATDIHCARLRSPGSRIGKAEGDIRTQSSQIASCDESKRYKTEGLKQKETLDSLPKGIRSNIAYHLFFPVIEKVYLFRGVSFTCMLQLVTEMEAEYFPPRELVIVKNEAPTDVYIIVSGAVEERTVVDGVDKVHGMLSSGDIFGEIGALCNVPQPSTFCTTKVSQLLRNGKSILFSIIWQKTTHQTFSAEAKGESIGMHNRQFIKYNSCWAFNQVSQENESEEKGRVTAPCRDGNCTELDDSGRHGTIHSTGIHDNDWPAKGYQNTHGINQDTWEHAEIRNTRTQDMPTCSDAGKLLEITDRGTKGSLCSDKDGGSVASERKRVTIHLYSQQNKNTRVTSAKVINLPGSVEELFALACKCSNSKRSLTIKGICSQYSGLIFQFGCTGQKFAGYSPTKLFNQDFAEIDDISVIQDGDHLILMET
ncbi:hypothetical protein PR202_gb27088 [Eleusine coracana subsp. coracana]|uniref:Potassium channel n=1 Tax=Eleusine coracana subsp. coracana TaxID=191504 RepID=A0AAV5FQX0_ELECO|nr:hypothetical protein PR202_gb27088 [Eleusine coracana subsp. coracana]